MGFLDFSIWRRHMFLYYVPFWGYVMPGYGFRTHIVDSAELKTPHHLWVYWSSCASNFLVYSIQIAYFSVLDLFCLIRSRIGHAFIIWDKSFFCGWCHGVFAWNGHFLRAEDDAMRGRMAMLCYSLDTLWAEEWHSWLEALKGVSENAGNAEGFPHGIILPWL